MSKSVGGRYKNLIEKEKQEMLYGRGVFAEVQSQLDADATDRAYRRIKKRSHLGRRRLSDEEAWSNRAAKKIYNGRRRNYV